MFFLLGVLVQRCWESSLAQKLEIFPYFFYHKSVVPVPLHLELSLSTFTCLDRPCGGHVVVGGEVASAKALGECPCAGPVCVSIKNPSFSSIPILPTPLDPESP